MTDSSQKLLEKMKCLIADNLCNEQFGVQQLANMIGISRSHLHRKLHKIYGKSISRYIREYRLDMAYKMLLEKEATASEVAHEVGFSSSSYFNKCFTEYFGYPPGKTRLKAEQLIIKETNSKYIEPDKNLIMVLPFKNLSSDIENQYLADGMVNAINRILSGINDFKVISSSATINMNSLSEIRKKIGITKVIQGSLQRQGNMIRIEIKLLNTLDESQIWAQNFDRTVLDILKIQNEISEKIVKELKANISIKEQSIITKRTSYKPLAYDSYLKGMYYMNHFGEKKIDQSLTYFKKAIEIDPSIAPAYAAIANYYQMKASIFSATIDSKEAFKNAELYLDLALKLDKDWYFNFTLKAFQLTFFHWDFEEANKNYKIGLKAKESLNYFMYRDFLQFENRHEEALKVSLTINRKTPFYPNYSLIMSYYYNGMYNEGERYINERLKSFPKEYLIYDNSGFFMLNTGNYNKAIQLFQQLIEMENKRFPRIVSWMGAAYAHKGETKKSKALLNELKELKSKTNAGSPAFFISIIYTALGEKQKALKWLETAVEDREMEIPWLVSEPRLYPLHGMTEFDALVKKVGFREHAYPVKLPNQN